jgi:archaemetzincin
MESTTKRIGVVPLGEIPPLIPKIVAAHIESYLHTEADILLAEDLPEVAYSRQRLQYDAGKMIKFLESRPPTAHEKNIAILSVDLFVPIFSHVFGESRQGGNWALTSVFRLEKQQNGSIPAPEILYERTAKVALHEIGHLFRLVHCDDPLCLMHFSGGLTDLDRTPLQFCRYCAQYWREAI